MTRTRPRGAMSARQLDRVQGEVKACLELLRVDACPDGSGPCPVLTASERIKTRLTRLLRSLERSERR